MKRWILSNFKLQAPALLVLGGTGVLCFNVLYNSIHANSVEAAPITTKPVVINVHPEKPLISGKPIHLSIPVVGIDLHVVDGFYNKTSRQWTLTGDKAQFATITTPLNNYAGLSFIYGHNNKQVLGRIKNIQLGQVAVLKTDQNQVFYYKFVKTEAVKPENTSIFNYSGDPILVIQTCSGSWNQNRQMYYFDLVRAEVSQ